jgi:hypothetical protein
MRAEILSLRPTQLTVGMREVSKKQDKIAGRCSSAMVIPRIPALLGPARQLYLHDRHHYSLALHRMGVKQVEVEIVEDLSHLDAGTFWLTLALRSWARPIDGTGKRHQFIHMPASILGLEDDPFRSLAGELRRLGFFVKDTAPYTDFAWADFLRHRMRRARVDSSFDAAMDEAIAVVRETPEARLLPGWKPFPQRELQSEKTPAVMPPPPASAFEASQILVAGE